MYFLSLSLQSLILFETVRGWGRGYFYANIMNMDGKFALRNIIFILIVLIHIFAILHRDWNLSTAQVLENWNVGLRISWSSELVPC